MKTIVRLTFSIALLVFATSCNKNKINSKTLQGTTWNFTSLTIDGVADSNLAELEFGEGNIYKEILTGKWHNYGHSHGAAEPEVNFVWQFRDKGKTFEISNQSEGEDAVQCSMLSGVYTVDENSKTEYIISSNATIGYNGKTIIIKMKKE